MSKTFLIHVTDNVRTGKSTRTQKDYSVTECWVMVDGEPYPVKLEIFGINCPAGKYLVPYKHEVYQGRLQVVFDFSKAVPHQPKAN